MKPVNVSQRRQCCDEDGCYNIAQCTTQCIFQKIVDIKQTIRYIVCAIQATQLCQFKKQGKAKGKKKDLIKSRWK